MITGVLRFYLRCGIKEKRAIPEHQLVLWSCGSVAWRQCNGPVSSTVLSQTRNELFKSPNLKFKKQCMFVLEVVTVHLWPNCDFVDTKNVLNRL